MPIAEAIRDWYHDIAPTQSTAEVTWDTIFRCWRALELDFHHRYQADFGDGVLDRRDWRWFAVRVSDLLDDNTSRLTAAVKTLLSPPTGGARV